MPKPGEIAEVRQRVLYLISGVGGGQGGHFHSLKDLVLAVRERVDARVVCVGPEPSAVLADLPIPVDHVASTGLGYFRVARRLREIADRHQPTVLHAFDAYAWSFAASCARRQNVGALLTKAGGPNPRWYFPSAPCVICFSEENARYFAARGQRVSLIPARVSSSRLNSQDFECVPESSPKVLDVVRIGRITPRYKQAIDAAIETYKVLVATGRSARLVLIGIIQDEQYARELRDQLKEFKSKLFITEKSRVRNASRYLHRGQLVIGTGRGAMEALWRGCVVLCPVANGPLPELVDLASVDRLLETNFSGRGATPRSIAERDSSIRRVVETPEDMEMAGIESVRLFSSRFELERRIDEYASLYSEASLSPLSVSIPHRMLAKAYSFRGLALGGNV